MEVFSAEACTYCAHEQPASFKFCANCGKRNSAIAEKEKKAENAYKSNLNRLATYAFITLGLLITSSLTDDTLEVLIGVTIVFAVVDVIFGVIQPSVWKLIDISNVRLLPMVCIIGIGLCSGIVVSFSMDHLNLLLFEETSGYMYLFYHLENPLWMAILFIAVFPAIFEELAFRGFVFNNLQVIGGEKSAVFGSAFIFALVHLSLLSFVWIIPFGVLLAYFRRKYSTLIYGMVGHFVHNTVTILIEYYDIFS